MAKRQHGKKIVIKKNEITAHQSSRLTGIDLVNLCYTDQVILARHFYVDIEFALI